MRGIESKEEMARKTPERIGGPFTQQKLVI